MEESTSYNNEEESDQFFDAYEHFPLPDSDSPFQSQPSASDSALESADSHKPRTSPEYSPPSTLRRRRSSISKHNEVSDDGSTVINETGTGSVHDDDDDDATTTLFTERKSDKYRSFKEHLRKIDNSMANRGGVSSTSNALVDGDVKASVAEPENAEGSSSSSSSSSSDHHLVYLAELMIKAIAFQVKLLFNIFTFPIWSVYSMYMFVMDPFGVVKNAREYLRGTLMRFWSVVCENVSPSVYAWLKEQKLVWKTVMRFGLGVLWAGYVGFVLFSLLASSFVISGLVIRHVVEEPVQIKKMLNFDYTKNSPVAFVPIISSPRVTPGLSYGEKVETGKGTGMALHVIPPNHNLQVSVSLTLPESEYNQRLGIFQVRVDFLSAKWERIGSLRHLCMLQYKSIPIRLLSTFLKTAPLVTGYSSESQTLNVKMQGFTEGDVPTSCLKVIIEQRAEFRPGAGIPEIYAASLLIQSELPLFKRLIWSWKTTLFVWIALTVFMTELMFALLCCRPIIMPRVRTRNASSQRYTPQNTEHGSS